MNTPIQSTLIFSAFALAFSFGAFAQEGTVSGAADLRPGITGFQKPQGFICANNGYVSGIALKLTDRVTALFAKCQTATWNGLWSTDPPTSDRIAGDATPFDVELSCPQNEFVNGIGYATGHYSADTHGMAQPDIGRLIANLRVVCSRQLKNQHILPAKPLSQAEDNDVQVVSWFPGNPHDCKPGFAAVGFAINFEFKRDLDPNNRFYDVALYCRRLNVGLRHGLNQTP